MNNDTASQPFNQHARAASLKVIDYADAPQDVKDKMELVMKAIDQSPASLEAVLAFGGPVLERLANIPKAMSDIKLLLVTQAAKIDAASQKMLDAMKELELDKFGSAVQRLLVNIVGGSSSKADRELVQKIQNALPKLLVEMTRIIDGFAATEMEIKTALQRVDTLKQERVDALHESAIYIGAIREVLRRYNKEYIPEAKQAFVTSLREEARQNAFDVMRRKDDFIDRAILLEKQRVAGVTSLQEIDQLAEKLDAQRQRILETVTSSQAEWKAMISAAGVAGLPVMEGRKAGNAKPGTPGAP